MANSPTRAAINHHFSASRLEENDHPAQEFVREPHMMQDIEQKGPRDRIKGSRDVQLEKHSCLPVRVYSARKLANKQEIVMQVMTFNKRRLVYTDEGIHFRSEPDSKQLRE
jgi:hypothetical protein